MERNGDDEKRRVHELIFDPVSGAIANAPIEDEPGRRGIARVAEAQQGYPA